MAPPKKESPVEPFKRVLALAVRAIAQDKEVQVTFGPGKPELDGKSVQLELTDLAPTWGMEIKYRLKGTDGRAISGTIHNTVHALGK